MEPEEQLIRDVNLLAANYVLEDSVSVGNFSMNYTCTKTPDTAFPGVRLTATSLLHRQGNVAGEYAPVIRNLSGSRSVVKLTIDQYAGFNPRAWLRDVVNVLFRHLYLTHAEYQNFVEAYEESQGTQKINTVSL